MNICVRGMLTVVWTLLMIYFNHNLHHLIVFNCFRAFVRFSMKIIFKISTSLFVFKEIQILSVQFFKNINQDSFDDLHLKLNTSSSQNIYFSLNTSTHTHTKSIFVNSQGIYFEEKPFYLFSSLKKNVNQNDPLHKK